MLRSNPIAASEPAPNPSLLKNIQTPAALLGVDYSPDDKRVVAGGLGRDIAVYETLKRASRSSPSKGTLTTW